MLDVRQHADGTYQPRTRDNARAADLTVAIAIDFETAGERLTRSAAGDRYLAIPITEEPLQAARQLFKALRARNARTLNVAGNGIYSLAQHGWTQEQVDDHVHTVIAKVHEHWPLEKVISGGQTGVDQAGIVAAVALGIPAAATLPKGFLRRGTDRVDRRYTEEQVRSTFEWGAARLRAIAAGAAPRGSLRVVSKREGGTQPHQGETVVDIDRSSGSPLGNQSVLKNAWDFDERVGVIVEHVQRMDADIDAKGPMFQELQRIGELLAQGERIALRCHCDPALCHGHPTAERIYSLRGWSVPAAIAARVAELEVASTALRNSAAQQLDLLAPGSDPEPPHALRPPSCR